MNHAPWIPCTALLLGAFLLPSCAKTTYVDGKGNDLVVSAGRMNIQDWTQLSDKVVQSMVTSGVLQSYSAGGPAGLLLNPLQNDTGEQFDGDAILKKIRIALLQTGRVQVITAGSMGLAAEDPIAQRAKARQQLAAGLEDPLADVPALTIQAKIFRDRVRAEGQQQSAYFLQMTLTDTKSGRGIWEDEVSIVKRGSKSAIGF